MISNLDIHYDIGSLFLVHCRDQSLKLIWLINKYGRFNLKTNGAFRISLWQFAKNKIRDVIYIYMPLFGLRAGCTSISLSRSTYLI